MVQQTSKNDATPSEKHVELQQGQLALSSMFQSIDTVTSCLTELELWNLLIFLNQRKPFTPNQVYKIRLVYHFIQAVETKKVTLTDEMSNGYANLFKDLHEFIRRQTRVYRFGNFVDSPQDIARLYSTDLGTHEVKSLYKIFIPSSVLSVTYISTKEQKQIESFLRGHKIDFPSYQTIHKAMLNLQSWGAVGQRTAESANADFMWILMPDFLVKYGARLIDQIEDNYNPTLEDLQKRKLQAEINEKTSFLHNLKL